MAEPEVRIEGPASEGDVEMQGGEGDEIIEVADTQGAEGTPAADEETAVERKPRVTFAECVNLRR